MRRPDWTSRMYGVIDTYRTEPFDWGKNSCGLFVARVIDAMTDGDLCSRLGYTDEASALALIESHGGLMGTAIHFLGEPSTGRPKRGDVVLFDGGAGDAVGIWDRGEIFSVGEKGLHRIKADCAAFWRIA